MKHSLPAVFALAFGFVPYLGQAESFRAVDQPELLDCRMDHIERRAIYVGAGYSSAGTCKMLRAAPQPASKPGESKFPDFSNATVLYHVNWTADGSYNNSTRMASEEVTVPPPGLDQPSPPGRPHGRFKWETTCDRDPWLDTTASKCAAPRIIHVTGNLGGEVQKRLALTGKPFTAHMTRPQRAALAAQASRCASGFVWRERFDGDTVCVKPDERYRLADGTCRNGWVWRDTFPGDTVCVTPRERDKAWAAAGKPLPGTTAGKDGGFIQMIPPSGTQAPPATPQRPVKTIGKTRTAAADTNIYDNPGGKVLGIMRGGKSGKLLQKHPDGWCKLDALPPDPNSKFTGGPGWVWLGDTCKP